MLGAAAAIALAIIKKVPFSLVSQSILSAMEDGPQMAVGISGLHTIQQMPIFS
jgi:hypothetical protein